jgi:Tol biopolymer transport system component
VERPGRPDEAVDRSNRDGVYGIYVMNPDGSGLRRLTNRSE